MAINPRQYTNQRRRLEELEEMVPRLLASVSGMGKIVTYLVDQMGGQVTIPRASLRETAENKTVDSDSDPESEELVLFIKKETP